MNDHIKNTPVSVLAKVPVGPQRPVRIMGVVNASPESFYVESVRSSEKAISKLAEQMEEEGANFIDVGAMSSAPYLKTQISEREEANRLKSAVRAIKKGCSLPISIDTYRIKPAAEGLEAGASILNDITGFSSKPSLTKLAKEFDGVILMANPKSSKKMKLTDPAKNIIQLFQQSLDWADEAGLERKKIVLDPGIGFFRQTKMTWWKWDLLTLKDLPKICEIGIPLLVGVSRKSFIGHLIGGASPQQRLSGSLSATAIAVINGASIIRTHDVRATSEACKVAKTICDLKTN